VNSEGAVAVNLASSDAPGNVRRAQAVLTTMQLAFPEVVVYGVPGPEWLNTKKGSVNLIFFGGKPVPAMRDAHFLDALARQMNRDRFPPEGFAFFISQEPVVLAPGEILTDDFSPLDLLQGEG